MGGGGVPTSPRKSPKKKKIWFNANEVKALRKVVDVQRKAGNFDGDAVWETIEGSEACQRLKLSEKYCKIQLVNKVKKLAAANK